MLHGNLHGKLNVFRTQSHCRSLSLRQIYRSSSSKAKPTTTRPVWCLANFDSAILSSAKRNERLKEEFNSRAGCTVAISKFVLAEHPPVFLCAMKPRWRAYQLERMPISRAQQNSRASYCDSRHWDSISVGDKTLISHTWRSVSIRWYAAFARSVWTDCNENVSEREEV